MIWQIGQVIFEEGTTWKQISNHIFFPKNTSLESEKIKGILGGTGVGGQKAQSVAPSTEVKKYPLILLANTTNLSFRIFTFLKMLQRRNLHRC